MAAAAAADDDDDDVAVEMGAVATAADDGDGEGGGAPADMRAPPAAGRAVAKPGTLWQEASDRQADAATGVATARRSAGSEPPTKASAREDAMLVVGRRMGGAQDSAGDGGGQLRTLQPVRQEKDGRGTVTST